ncbi:MAG: ABC transporter permease [Cyclobacteriaceae bacterium]
MLRNYFTTALRNVLRSPFFSSINLLGMVLGITCSSLILLFAWDELHYDQYHTNAKNIYRITTQQEKATTIGAVTPGPLAPELKNNFPEVVNTARVGKWSGVFKTKDALYEESQIYFADNSLLQIFDFPMIKGDLKTVLKQPNQLVLNEKMAIKYFGAEWKSRPDILGTTFRLNNESDFVVAGIIQNAPSNSSFQFDFLLSFNHLLSDRWSYNWGSYNFITYVQLNPDQNIDAFNAKIKNVLRTHDKEAGFNISTQPLTEIYLHPLNYDLWTKQGNLPFIRIFVIIGMGILFIACFNFINLSTAQSTRRSKEVGIRKTIGASRAQIFVQFLGESFLIVGCAALLSRGLIDLALPYFNSLSGKELTLHPINKIFFALLLVFTLIIGLLASLYPASLLSSFQPIKTLRGILPKKAGGRFREVLVVAQFSIAIILMIGTSVIYQQLLFIQQKDLGFEKEQLMYVGLSGDLKENEEVFRAKLTQQHEVIGAAATTSILANNNNYSNIKWEGQPKGQELTITQMNADPYFIPLMDMKMVNGRNFSTSVAGDSSAYIINETAAKNMGFTGEDALGKEVGFWGMKGKIIGVVRDFHFRPMNVPIEPFIMRYQAKTFYFKMLVKIKPNQVAGFIEKLPALYHQFDKENPLDYGFVDEQLNKQYKNEQRAATILANFTGLSIFITCLGLLGLAAYSAEQRSKEIGIRKVLGASVAGIVQLLSKDFIRPILMAIVIGTPLAWYAMSQWLESFAYRTEIHWWIFVFTGLLAILIAIVTVSSQAIKAAISNPVESLRSE